VGWGEGEQVESLRNGALKCNNDFTGLIHLLAQVGAASIGTWIDRPDIYLAYQVPFSDQNNTQDLKPSVDDK
jgi:hypothetical protein